MKLFCIAIRNCIREAQADDIAFLGLNVTTIRIDDMAGLLSVIQKVVQMLLIKYIFLYLYTDMLQNKYHNKLINTGLTI